MSKILTQQPKAPWWHVAVILLPWFAYEFHNQVSRSALTFTLKKFTDDPSTISFITSFNYACGLLVGSVVSLISDRIWTRHGRRRPFLIFGFLGSAVVSFFIPHLTFLWGVGIGILIYQAVYDVVNPLEPLTMEVIPPAQRGRAGAIRQWYAMAASILFYYVLIGQFDHTYQLPGGFDLTGETVIYIVNSLFLAICGLLMLLMVREVKPPDANPQPLREVRVWPVIRGLFTRELLPLFGLTYVFMNLWVGLDQFEGLLITEQWGYSKAEYGQIMSYGMMIALLVVPLGGWASDRFDRLVLLKTGLGLVLGLQVIYYFYAEYFAPGGVPEFGVVIGLGLIRAMVQKVVIVAAIPLIFDYVSTNRLGALSCGMGVTLAVVNFIQANMMGTWIEFSSEWLYGLPEGRYNYMTAYHYLFLMGLGGIAYLYLFAHWDRTGYVKRRPKNAPVEAGADSTESANGA